MNKINNMKALVLSLAMALGMLLPTTTNAQNDGFFRGNMDNYENRDAGINSNDGAGISNWGIGEEVPLGSGLLVLVAAGAGYAAMRRKRNKRGVALIIALAMILTMSNCKKNVETISNVTSNGVQITLDVDGGSKVDVNPTGGGTFATVDFESGDIIYVGNNGHYCGYLEHNGTYFTGSIDETNLSNDDYLHFYFIGNKGTTSQPSSVSITDQTSKYPVISYAHSKQLYYGAGSYTAKLENYCAIVKFTTTNIAADITITGMNNTVAVNFGANNAATGTGVGNNPYTPGKTGDGEITLHRVSNTERWAILLKQNEEVTTATAYAFQNVATKYVSSTFTVPEIDNNMYYTNDGSGISIDLTEYVPYIDAEFTVASGRTVKFSRGNLQYKGTTGMFRFAENQYDYVGKAAGNTAPSASQAAWIDLFGWGTSGYNNKYPYMTSTNDGDYVNSNLDGTNYDWGVYNKQSNQNKIEGGGNHDWRVLTIGEWRYLFNERTGHRYAKATVCSKDGVILLPDNWSDGTYTLSKYNDGGAGFDSNNINTSDWATLEAAGCVFLPAAMFRYGTTVYDNYDMNLYWSSTIDGSDPYPVKLCSDEISLSYFGMREHGCSVRVVF